MRKVKMSRKDEKVETTAIAMIEYVNNHSKTIKTIVKIKGEPFHPGFFSKKSALQIARTDTTIWAMNRTPNAKKM